MNQKKAKFIRKSLRSNVIDPREKVYAAAKNNVTKAGEVYTGTIHLLPTCGRARYKALKQVVQK